MVFLINTKGKTLTTSSMTAFAHQQSDYPWGSATWELRSVSHRYLELSFKLPESWRNLEPSLRDALRKGLQRGKVECALKVQLHNQQQALQLNNVLASQILDAANKLNQISPTPRPSMFLSYCAGPAYSNPKVSTATPLAANYSKAFNRPSQNTSPTANVKAKH